MAIQPSHPQALLRRLLAAVGAIAIILVQSPSGGAQSSYTYTVIDQLSPTGTFWAPSINGSGQVAFIANATVSRGDGIDLTALYGPSPDRFPAGGYTSINASGTVAFGAASILGSEILVADGVGPVTTIGRFNSEWAGVFDPSINDQGQVVFVARKAATQQTYIVMGNSFTPIASPGDAVPGGTLVSAYGPKINNSGDIGFTAVTSTNATDIFRTTGGLVTRMGTASATGALTFGMNDAGIVAFWTNMPTARIVTSDGVSETIIAESGPGFSLEPHVAPVNDAGRVAFLVSDGLGGPNGVYVGDGVTAPWPVLRPGDSIPGLGTVLNTSITNHAINDRGQVAIAVTYDDGGDTTKYAIIRADPGNVAPVALNDSLETNEDQALLGTLKASDGDGDSLAFSIVTGGSLGSAVITDSATGAFTYTPSPGSSGTDTFTFKANDGTIDSNVATVSVTISPDAACASDVTGSVDIALGMTKIDRRTGVIVQKVTLKNIAQTAINGPVSFVLDGLPAGGSVVGATGTTSCSTPAGSPYVNINVGADGVLRPRERATLELRLNASGGANVTYTPRLLAGTGAR